MEIPSKGSSWTNESGEIENQKVKDFNILYTNADSLMNKRHELLVRLDDLNFKPHVIAITEVKNKKKNNINVAEFNMKGYCM